MISPDFFVEKLCEMTEKRGGKYGIEWHEDIRGGNSGEVNGVRIHLSTSGANTIRLTLQRGMLEAYIDQPVLHISQAPIGKVLQRVSQSVAQSIDRSSDYSWPRAPSSPEEKAREQLRVALGRLFSLVLKQQEEREESRFDETVRATLFNAALSSGQKKV